MAETQTENPVDWKTERAKNALEPGLYEQLLKDYPGIKIESAPTKQAQATISYNGKQVSFGPRMGTIKLSEVREQLGEPVPSSQKKIEYSPGFSLNRIDTKALNALDRCCNLRNSMGNDGKGALEVILKDDFEAVISNSEGSPPAKLPPTFKFPSDVMKVELLQTGKMRGGPVMFQSTLDDGSKEYIQIYQKSSGYNGLSGKIEK